ncbi:MAG TPA: dihydrofolate reductase family protein [Vicinamibacterales bacterium]|nr:dihydrofolate reductase family protein [Vicinamibacterales bacterium]
MRKVIYGGACSLDGFLTDRNGAIDWLHFSKDVEQIMARSWASADTILFGRKTWEIAAAQGGGGSMRGVKSYVFSRTLAKAPKGAELVSGNAGAFVRELKSQPGKDIIVMSGGNLAASLLREHAIDEIGLNVHPMLLGAGVPAFLDAGERVRLELTESRPLDGGCVLMVYRVR